MKKRPSGRVLTEAGHFESATNPFENMDSIEGVIVVSRDILVDLFVLNHFHTAMNVLIVSESGYPHTSKVTVERFLSENPNAPLYILHDLEDLSNDMSSRILRSTPFHFGERSIIDMGLSADETRAGVHLAFVDQEEWKVLSRRVASAFGAQTTLGAVPRNTNLKDERRLIHLGEIDG